MLYIGIDNGLDGGLCAVSNAGTIDGMETMPTTGLAKGREVDPEAIASLLKLYIGDRQLKDVCVILETPGKFSAGRLALTSMWDSYGAVRSVLSTMRLRHLRIPPAEWQKPMLPGCAKGNTKPFALSVARRLWPHEQFLASSRCRTPHDGLVDAALIAEWGRRKQV